MNDVYALIRCNGFVLTNKDIDLELCRRIIGNRYRSSREFVFKEDGFTALCYCKHPTPEEYGKVILLNGDIYGSNSADSVCSSHNLHDTLALSDGNYTLVCIDMNDDDNDGGVIAFARDPLGSKPFYYEHNGSSVTVASDRRVLNTYLEVEPGALYVFRPGRRGMERIRFSPIEYKPYVADVVSMDDAIKHVRNILSTSLKRRLSGRAGVVVGVSGIDSIILAVLSEQILDDVIPVTVCTKGSYDEMNARYIQEITGLSIHTLMLDEQDILNIIDDISTLGIDLDLANAMDVSISCIIYALARFARDNGVDALMLGQLADELFGGYARYLRYASSNSDNNNNSSSSSIHGLDGLNMMLFNDVKRASHDLCRDESIASSMLIDLILPYASAELAAYVVNLPAIFKVDVVKGVRKLLLRKVAESIGVAHEVAYREKKAMQFSTGIFKIVKRIIKTYVQGGEKVEN
ncbi:MAG: asparagine synthase-related protein [Candidatus Nitrosocaldus sp.]